MGDSHGSDARSNDLLGVRALRAQNGLDQQQATRLARMMVTRWGLSEELGTVSYGENQDEVFLGMSVSRTQNASEATVQKIAKEMINGSSTDHTKIFCWMR
jgi:ATP-dependent Zn protease